jgi:hypothetical protein
MPKHNMFKPRTVWSLSNAFTNALKEARDDCRYEFTARLGRFFDLCNTPANLLTCPVSHQYPAAKSRSAPMSRKTTD